MFRSLVGRTWKRTPQKVMSLAPVLLATCPSRILSSYSYGFTCSAAHFHSSSYALASKKDKPAKSVVDVVLPDTKDLDLQMEKKITRLVDEFAKLRSGQANTEIFRTVMVESGGARVSVADAGQLSVKSPTKMSISVFDPSITNAVAEAIRECGMGLTPTIEGNNIVMSIPKPSKEAKEALVKTARVIADKVSSTSDYISVLISIFNKFNSFFSRLYIAGEDRR